MSPLDIALINIFNFNMCCRCIIKTISSNIILSSTHDLPLFSLNMPSPSPHSPFLVSIPLISSPSHRAIGSILKIFSVLFPKSSHNIQPLSWFFDSMSNSSKFLGSTSLQIQIHIYQIYIIHFISSSTSLTHLFYHHLPDLFVNLCD